VDPGAGDIGQLIVASDCVVGFFSTALPEAAATGRPVIVVQPEQGCWAVDWSTMGLAQSGSTAAGIADLVKASLGKIDPAAPIVPEETKEQAVMNCIAAIDSVIDHGLIRPHFLPPSEIFVKYHKPANIVG
jgi:hypothetical protein